MFLFLSSFFLVLICTCYLAMPIFCFLVCHFIILISKYALWQDPFLLISRISDSGMPVPICKTEVRKNDLNPRWKPVILNLQQIGSKAWDYLLPFYFCISVDVCCSNHLFSEHVLLFDTSRGNIAPLIFNHHLVLIVWYPNQDSFCWLMTKIFVPI